MVTPQEVCFWSAVLARGVAFSDAMRAGATSRLIGGRAGGRAKISLPSRDADEVQDDSGSSSVNAAATAATVAAAVPAAAAAAVPAASVVPATSAVPAVRRVAWSGARAAGKRAPAAVKRAADAAKTAPLSDRELLEQALRAQGSQVPPGLQPRRSGSARVRVTVTVTVTVRVRVTVRVSPNPAHPNRNRNPNPGRRQSGHRCKSDPPRPWACADPRGPPAGPGPRRWSPSASRSYTCRRSVVSAPCSLVITHMPLRPYLTLPT